MATPTWPAELPSMTYPAASHNYARKASKDAALRTSMDAGPDKVRRRFTAVPHAVTFTKILTQAQLDIEQDFYHNVVGVAGRFDHFDPVTQTTQSWRYVEETAYAAAGGGQWRATFSLEVLP